MRVRVNECEKIPPLYGVAYREYEYNWTVCYPIPINIIIKYLREIWFLIKTTGRSAAWWESREAEPVLRIRDIERHRAQQDMLSLASRLADKMFQEKVDEEIARRIKILLEMQ